MYRELMTARTKNGDYYEIMDIRDLSSARMYSVWKLSNDGGLYEVYAHWSYLKCVEYVKRMASNS